MNVLLTGILDDIQCKKTKTKQKKTFIHSVCDVIQSIRQFYIFKSNQIV